ncbi:ATP-binding protein [Halobaculum gomorrense]|uniref:DNA helicase n=1 Tax=Halobaculum gomorrense TaxID=43928 RepID=A0A1M5MP11_9EURY|nr:ATP-binding protein [Halobaculum gomorrense]SHG78503.1 replicative DNA helicase Mcm [Halobaculum gomorrense]
MRSEGDFVEQFSEYFRWEIGGDVALLAQQYPDRQSLTVDWTDFARWNPHMAEDVLDRPGDYHESVEEGLRTTPLPVDNALGKVTVRWQNLPDSHTTSPGEFSPTERQGDLLALEGQVAKRTQMKPRLVEAAFECQRCGTMTYILQEIGGYREPFECQGCEKQGPFRVHKDESTYRDYQKLLLENPASAASGGDTADMVVHLLGDLAGHASIEDCQDIVIVGELEFRGGGPTPDPQVEANSIEASATDVHDVEFSEAERDLFERLRERPESFDVDAPNPTTADVLMEAAAPKFVAGSHPRDRQVVRGIVMQLVGASTFDASDGSHYRGDLHVLLPGDPGTGKSVLAKWVAAVAPRSAFASGERVSGPGLTAAAVKDDFSDGGFSIEPGTLVRAHGGIAVVDELDKAGEGAISKMHSALADQIVPISLAGQSMTLPAECGLLGVANPTGGHFTGGESLVDALPLESPLLSRFDLIFQMRSKQDRDHVRELSESMMRTWAAALKDERGDALDDDERQEIEGILSLEEYHAVLLRARQLDPVPTEEAIEALSEWFAEQKLALPDRYGDALANADGDYAGPPMPVTARKLGAARRVAQASARANLRETMTLEDVEHAKELVSRSLGDLDIPIVYNGGVGGGAVTARDETELTGVTS